MKKNIFKEASERYQEFKILGFIPENEKYVYRDFVKEVASERKTNDFVGRYTAKGYSKKLGIKVSYGSGENLEQVMDRYLEHLLEKYKAELLDIFDLNDFISLAEKYKEEAGFEIYDVMNVDSFLELVRLARKALQVQPFLFRNINGRNRRTESSQIDNYYDSFAMDLKRFISEVNKVISMHDL